MRLQKTSGFTIVELLIVIVVIAILAAITIVAYNGIQARSRDATRSSDVAGIKKALELYKTDVGNYPAVCGAGDNQGCSVSGLSSVLVPTYTNKIPQDPVSTSSYSYVRGPAADGSYAIYIAGYETRGVCKTGVNVNTGWWNTSTPAC